jgi:hypothetical protein
VNQQSFDPLQIGRYTVICVYYEYAGQPGGMKLFVSLRQGVQAGQGFCFCIKATSQVQNFSPEMLKGCVYYKAGETLFEQNTVVDPSNILTLLHSTMSEEANLGRYKILGKMPADFHERFVAAVRASITLEPKKKSVLLEAVGESLSI